MKVEFPVRWETSKKVSPEEEEVMRILNNSESEEAVTFHYDLIVLDLKDIRSFNKLDANHTVLRTFQNENYCIGVDYNRFLNLWTDLTGEAIMRLGKVEIDEDKPKRKKKKGDDDIFM